MRRIEYKNGTYQGQFINNSKFGLGMYVWDNGNSYFGEWFKDECEGEGFLQIPNYGIIQGHFKKGKLHGSTYQVSKNGQLRFATYQYGRLDGRAVTITAQKDVNIEMYMKGQLIDVIDQPQGEDVEIAIDKILTSLSSIDEIIERSTEGGFGFQNVQQGSSFVGVLTDDIPHGLGSVSYLYDKLIYGAKNDIKHQDIMVGTFENGVLNGFGSLYKSNGDVYIGFFENRQMQGGGIYWIQEQKKWYFGQFTHSKCEKIIKSSSGTWEDFLLEAWKLGLMVHQNCEVQERVKFPHTQSPEKEKLRTVSMTEKELTYLSLNYSGDLSQFPLTSGRKTANERKTISKRGRQIDITSESIQSKENRETRGYLKNEERTFLQRQNFAKHTCSSRSKQRQRQTVITNSNTTQSSCKPMESGLNFFRKNSASNGELNRSLQNQLQNLRTLSSVTSSMIASPTSDPRGHRKSEIIQQTDQMQNSAVNTPTVEDIGCSPSQKQGNTNIHNRLYEVIISNSPKILVDDQEPTQSNEPQYQRQTYDVLTTDELPEWNEDKSVVPSLSDQMESPKHVYQQLKLSQKLLPKISEHVEEYVSPTRKSSQQTISNPSLPTTTTNKVITVSSPNVRVNLSSFNPQMNQSAIYIRQPSNIKQQRTKTRSPQVLIPQEFNSCPTSQIVPMRQMPILFKVVKQTVRLSQSPVIRMQLPSKSPVRRMTSPQLMQTLPVSLFRYNAPQQNPILHIQQNQGRYFV